MSSSEIVLAVEGPDATAATAATAAADLRRKLRAPLRADIPDQVVVLPSLPLLPGGKVDRRGVRKLLNLEDAVPGA
jgi:D-alanine--poly(phosphoribitol) ligase subunit 1